MQTNNVRWQQDSDGTWVCVQVSHRQALDVCSSIRPGKTYDVTIKPHRERRSLRAGSLHELVSDGPVIAYGRSLGKDRVVVIVNVADEARYVSVPVWKTGANPDGRFENLLKTSPLGFDQIPDELAASGGYLEITMVGQSSIVLGEINE